MSDSLGYKVSIIVPVYNAEKYLPEAFESVKKQTIGFENIQLIMIDDRSGDGSFGLIKAWAEQYDNVTALQTPAGSGSASMPRNMGLDVAEADYIMFLDADDRLEPCAVELLYGLITTRCVDLADAAFGEMSRKVALDKRYLDRREGLYSIVEDADEFFPISHPLWTKIYKRSIIEDNGLRFDTKLRNGEDSLFIYEYLKHAENAWHTNELVYEYRIRESSVSHNVNKTYFSWHAAACDAIKSVLVGSDRFVYYGHFVEEVAIASVDILCDTQSMDESDCKEILKLFYGHIKHIADNGLDEKVPIGKILARDAGRDDYESYVEDFFAMRGLYRQRRDELDNIFNSRGWKLVSKLGKIKNAITGKLK